MRGCAPVSRHYRIPVAHLAVQWAAEGCGRGARIRLTTQLSAVRQWVALCDSCVADVQRPQQFVSRFHPGMEAHAAGGQMRKPRPNTYNPAQVLHLINSDRSGVPLSCPSCSGTIERDPAQYPPAPMSHVTLRCRSCGRTAKYIARAAGAA